MTTDLRGFDYPLEPLLRRRRWELESLEARLGRASRELGEAARALAELRSRHTIHTRAARALVARLDPASYPRALGWLAAFRDRIREAEEHAAELRAERARVAKLCLSARQKVDVIERHRSECVAEFSALEQARACADADRDWLLRVAVGCGRGTP